MLPVIGIVTSKMFVQKYLAYYNYLSTFYSNGIASVGGIPLLVPLLDGPDTPYRTMLEVLDGILLTGGEDPAPHLYGEQPLPGLGEVDYERDLAEIELITLAREMKKPLFGICRGIQILNVALGGTLIQDIPLQVEGAVQHAQKGSRKYGSHRVVLKPGRIADALGQTELLINSAHHQSVKDVAPGFRVTAVADDGVIEAIESDDGLASGVQWHPECMWQHDKVMLNLARSFVQLAAQHKKER